MQTHPRENPVVITDQRPWGSFERFTLNESSTVKLIYVQPGERLSLQRHESRDELWVALDPGAIFEGERHPLILRLTTPGTSAGGPLLQEAGLMRAAAAAGVPTPQVIAAGGEDGPLGAEFVVMARIEGETIPRRVLRSPELAAVRPL